MGSCTVETLDLVLSYALLVGLLLWLALSVATFWLWGGAKRNALGQLAAGALYLVAGTLFIYVAVINVYARMDNAYLSNGILGLALIVVGATLLIGSLAGYGVPWWGTLLVWLAAFALYWFGSSWLARVFPGDGGSLLPFAAFMLVAIFAYVVARRRGWDVAIAIALAGAGLALVWLVYGAGIEAFTPVGQISEPIIKPPLLDFWPFTFCLLSGVAVFLGGRAIQVRLRTPRTAR
jgi:hypothetical protein